MSVHALVRFVISVSEGPQMIFSPVRRWLGAGLVSVMVMVLLAGMHDVTNARASAPSVTQGLVTWLNPQRVVDTRIGLGAARSQVTGGHGLVVPLAGVAGVPTSDIAAVVVNVTVTRSRGAGYVTVHADGTGVPATSM